MTCPRCQQQTRVLRTLKLDNPLKVIRTRLCPSCNYCFSTQECLDLESTPQETLLNPPNRGRS